MKTYVHPSEFVDMTEEEVLELIGMADCPTPIDDPTAEDLNYLAGAWWSEPLPF